MATLTNTQREIVKSLIEKALNVVNLNNPFYQSTGHVKTFVGKIYTTITAQDFATDKETIIAFADMKNGIVYKSLKGVPNKRISLNVIECQVGDIIEFLFPLTVVQCWN